MQVEKHDGSRWNKTNTQEIKISLYSPEPDPRRRQDRLPGAAMLTGSPLPELLPRGLVEQGRPALETLRLPFATSVGRCLALGVCFCTGRWFPFFILQSQHKKIVRLANNTPIFFSFFVGFGSSRGAWAGIWCVWAHPLFRYAGPEKICVSAVILSVNSLLCTVQDRSASAASETGEGEGEKLNQVGQVLLAPEPPSSALSLDLARGTGVHWARLLWVVAVRIFGEPAQLPKGE